MRTYLFVILFFSLCFQVQAQKKSSPSNKKNDSEQIKEFDENQVFSYVGEMPKFQGGGGELFALYIQANLIYPQDAREKGITGTVYVQFIIEKDGRVTNVRIVPGRGVYPSLDQAAIDVIRNSPKWEPGKNNGVPVAVKKVTVIKFSL